MSTQTFDLGQPIQHGMAFPQSLAERYCPRTVAAFIGLREAKAEFSALLRAPRRHALLCVGPPGTGKTSLAMAFCEQLPGTLVHVGAQKCDAAMLETIDRRLLYYPGTGKFWVILIDEVDRATDGAQLQFLSKLDGTAALRPKFGGGYERGIPPNAIWIFTANGGGEDNTAPPYTMESRFLTRCLHVPFPAPDRAELAAYLKAIWKRERGPATSRNYFEKVAESVGVRDALMRLDSDLLAGPVHCRTREHVATKAVTAPIRPPEEQKRHEAALKAWRTMRAHSGKKVCHA